MKITNLAKAIAAGIGLFVSLMGGANADTLKIGVITPLTGAGAPWGVAMAEAAKIAAAHANAAGGLAIGGKKYEVQVIPYDDQYKAAMAVAAYNRLLKEDGVKYIIMMSSASTMAVKQSVEDDDVVVISSALTSKAIDANTKHLVRSASVPVTYIPPFVAWMKDHVKERNVVIINPNDETGWEQSNIDKRALEQNGFKVLDTELFERGQQDFQALLTKAISLNPELIDVGTIPPATAGLLIRQARDLGYKGQFFKTGGPGPQEIVAGAGGKEAVEGMIALAYANPATDGYQNLAAEYKKAIGQEPNQVIAQYYDSANVFLHAIQKGGDPNDVTKVLAAFPEVLPMKSIEGGEMTFGDRQILTPYFISVMKNGEAVVVAEIK